MGGRHPMAAAVEGSGASLGRDMLSGSIQHFLDFPHYAAVLLPLGVLVSLAAYMGRERLSPPRPQLLRLDAVAASFALAPALGLDILADQIAPHGHDH